MAKSKLARYKSKRKAKVNPQKKEAIEAAANVGAGFAGYATTRMISRLAYSQAVRRSPGSAPHVHVAASLAGAAGVYFGSKYWGKVDEYHEAASIGAGIALIQAAFQTYMPKLGWIVGDVSPEQYGAGKKKSVLPDADMTTIMPAERAALPAASGGLGEGFDLDALLAGDDSIEAVPIGQAPAVEDEGNMLPGFNVEDYGEDPLEHYNGMLQ